VRYPGIMLIALMGGISMGEARGLASGEDDSPGGSTGIALIVSEPGPIEDGEKKTQPAVPEVPVERTEEVHFRCGGNILAGVLVLPEAPGPFPAIGFVLGSGPADRTYYGMAPHLWRHFARRGFACLAWDKPGVGKSTGD
jgi:pimeloyl-ACP methyl ester carboxylesterase